MVRLELDLLLVLSARADFAEVVGLNSGEVDFIEISLSKIGQIHFKSI